MRWERSRTPRAVTRIATPRPALATPAISHSNRPAKESNSKEAAAVLHKVATVARRPQTTMQPGVPAAAVGGPADHEARGPSTLHSLEVLPHRRVITMRLEPVLTTPRSGGSYPPRGDLGCRDDRRCAESGRNEHTHRSPRRWGRRCSRKYREEQTT